MLVAVCFNNFTISCVWLLTMYVDAGGDGVGLGVVVGGGAAVDALVLRLDDADCETRRDLVVRVVVRRFGFPRRVVDPDPRRVLKTDATYLMKN